MSDARSVHPADVTRPDPDTSLARDIERRLADAPPLTPSQIETLTSLLRSTTK